jgi:PAS domain S-box-containing protein
VTSRPLAGDERRDDSDDAGRATRLERFHLAAIVDSSDDAIFSESLDGGITSWNRSAERMYGFSAAEIVGRSSRILIPENRRERELDVFERVAMGERIKPFETVHRSKDGAPVEVSLALSPIVDGTGKRIGISAICRDISETNRMRRSLTQARDAAEAANKELEAFSYSVAHDLRSPLRSIDGYSEALVDDCEAQLSADGRRYLGFIRESSQLMARLIEDILTLARVARSELVEQPVDLSALARAVASRLERRDPERNVEIAIEAGLAADCDARLMSVIFENLIGNAWKFTSKRTGARIEVGCGFDSGKPVFFVRDNGVGFDMKYASKLFGVFQRLHSTHEFDGNGVGLATVQRIVHRHHGRVWAESVVGAGTTVYFTLNGDAG